MDQPTPKPKMENIKSDNIADALAKLKEKLSAQAAAADTGPAGSGPRLLLAALPSFFEALYKEREAMVAKADVVFDDGVGIEMDKVNAFMNGAGDAIAGMMATFSTMLTTCDSKIAGGLPCEGCIENRRKMIVAIATRAFTQAMTLVEAQIHGATTCISLKEEMPHGIGRPN